MGRGFDPAVCLLKFRTGAAAKFLRTRHDFFPQHLLGLQLNPWIRRCALGSKKQGPSQDAHRVRLERNFIVEIAATAAGSAITAAHRAAGISPVIAGAITIIAATAATAA